MLRSGPMLLSVETPVAVMVVLLIARALWDLSSRE
jgi:hypothetical protein